jgi:hypothetical protein
MDGLNRDTAAYAQGEMAILRELEAALASQFTHLLTRFGGR